MSNPRVKRSTTKPQATRAKSDAPKAPVFTAMATPAPRPAPPTPAPTLPSDPARRGVSPGRGFPRYVPAFLSSIIPGLGQLVTGRRTLAALFLFPVVLLLAGVLVALVVMGPARLAASLIEPEVIWGIIGLQVLFVVWRLLAMTASVLDPAYPKPRARDVVPIGLLVLFIVVPQGLVLAVTDQARRTADEVFVGDQSTDGAWVPTTDAPTFGTPGFTDDPDLFPVNVVPVPTEGPQRVNVLLIGVDSAPGRSTYLTDTMIVASLDPVGGTVSMISVPRDMVDTPLPNGRTFRGKINSLAAYARNHPREFRGANGRGIDVLQGALGTLLGLRIDYYAIVNLPGFISVIDRLGGINVNVVRGFCDPTYTNRGFERGFSITAGRHHLDGEAALAYARVRKAAGESDFTRAGRQQEVLSGIRDRLVNGGFLEDPIGLLRSVSRTVQTNVPRKLVPDLVDWAQSVDREDTYRSVIDHPLVRGALDNRGSVQIPNIKGIRALADRLFTPPGTLPAKGLRAPAARSGKATSSGIGNCAPARTPRPTPRPTKKPTPKPTAAGTPKPTEAPTPTDPPATPAPDPT
jgi:polyisoprenyl-teichoic acid--peptidoglycan teichoic acid transferase